MIHLLTNILYRLLFLLIIPIIMVVSILLIISTIVFTLTCVLKWDSKSNSYKIYWFGKEIKS